MGSNGYYIGSAVMVSGSAGTGKTSVAAHFAASVAERGERCLYLAFEESPEQILRNMRSVGLEMSHSNQVREFAITGNGVRLLPVYVGPGGVLTGSARVAQEARDDAEIQGLEADIDWRKHAIDSRRQAMKAQIEALQAAFEADRTELESLIAEDQAELARKRAGREAMERSRTAIRDENRPELDS